MYDELIKAVINSTVDTQFAMDGVASGASSSVPIARSSASQAVQNQALSPSDFNLDALLKTRMQFVTDGGNDEIPCNEVGSDALASYLPRNKKHGSFVRRRRTVSFNLNLLPAEENQMPPKLSNGDRASLKRKPSGLYGRGHVSKQAATNQNSHDSSSRLQNMLLEEEDETESSDIEIKTIASADLASDKVFPRRAGTPRPSMPIPTSTSESPRRSFLVKSMSSSSPRRTRRPPPLKRSKRPLAEADNDGDGDGQSDSSGIVNNVMDFGPVDRDVLLRSTAGAAKKTSSKSKVHVTEDYLVQHLRDIVITNDYSTKSRLAQPSISDSLARMLNESLGIAPLEAAAAECLPSHATSISNPRENGVDRCGDAAAQRKPDLLAEMSTISSVLPVNEYDADDEGDTISIAGLHAVEQQVQSNNAGRSSAVVVNNVNSPDKKSVLRRSGDRSVRRSRSREF